MGAVNQRDVFYQVGGQSVHLKPGALTRINPETLHSCNPQTSDARRYSIPFLKNDWCLKVQSSLWQTDTFRQAVEPETDMRLPMGKGMS